MTLLVLLGASSLFLALASVLLGKNLTRSVIAGFASIGVLGIALMLAGLGLAAIGVCLMAMVGLACVQVFGWMLVDVDRDQIRPTDGPTWFARLLAFGLLGGGLVLLMRGLGPPMAALGGDSAAPAAAQIGAVLLGEWAGLSVLLGVVLAAALLAAMLLLRGTGEGG